MAKPAKEQVVESRDDVCEIIELAIDDIDTLTRAFEMISAVCAELSTPAIDFGDEIPEEAIN